MFYLFEFLMIMTLNRTFSMSLSHLIFSTFNSFVILLVQLQELCSFKYKWKKMEKRT